jgi:hypothetical protein
VLTLVKQGNMRGPVVGYINSLAIESRFFLSRF